MLHVVTPSSHGGMAAVVPGALCAMYAAADDAIENLACNVRKWQVNCVGMVREGALDDQVRAIVAEFGIDLLVMATKAGTGLDGYTLGSTAERILRKTFIPVITVGTCRTLRSWPDTGPAHILYATDFSDHSFRSLAYARSVRRRFSARLTLTHVVPFGARPTSVRSALDQLQGLAVDHEEIEVLHGAVGPAVCNAVANMGVDLVAVGVEKHTALGEYLFGHTLLEILAGSQCPVLTIRQLK
jgi:nucleotide-binding universal stress UspA family protein